MEKRINKFLSEVGFCSRREADRLIEENRVTINEKIPTLGEKITEFDLVKVDGKIIVDQNKKIYLAFNKPVGITSTTDRKIKGNIVDYINYKERIFHIGRLDKASEGLIFMTNDGDIVNKILRAGNQHQKEYVVTVDKEITDKFIKNMSEGVPILDTVTKKCNVYKINKFKFKIVLIEGLNRQIRRMCNHFDYEVKKLKRIRIMNVKLDLEVGQWRNLTEDELNGILKLVENSSKT